jgi:hypothetical protein
MKSSLTLLVLCLLVWASCSEQQQEAPAAAPHTDSIDISDVVVTLPEGKGKEEVEKSCVPCHSLRYIQMQPEMTRKSWDKVVTKMIVNFGAPVKDSATAAEIVDYLVAIKGKK